MGDNDWRRWEGAAADCVKGGREGEGEGERERGIQCCLNKNPERMKGKRLRHGRRERESERRGKNTHAQKQLQKVEIFFFLLCLLRARQPREKEEEEGEKSHLGFFFPFSRPTSTLNVSSHTPMTGRGGFRLVPAAQEDLMVSRRGAADEGRDLKALG